MTVRVLDCNGCGEAQRFDSYPYDGPDSDDVLDQYIRLEMWTFKDGEDYCPECSETDDE